MNSRPLLVVLLALGIGAAPLARAVGEEEAAQPPPAAKVPAEQPPAAHDSESSDAASMTEPEDWAPWIQTLDASVIVV
jgi:hypothetical protein